MKTKFNFYIICLMAISFLSVSCDKEDDSDTTKPIIDLMEPEDGDVLKIGDEHGIHLDMELQDNEMLGSYLVDIHPNFGNGHTHIKSASSETKDFNFKKSWDLSGKKNSDVHHHEILIPANATPGNYHFMVYCTDAAGNEVHVVRNIVLSTESGEDHEH